MNIYYIYIYIYMYTTTRNDSIYVYLFIEYITYLSLTNHDLMHLYHLYFINSTFLVTPDSYYMNLLSIK